MRIDYLYYFLDVAETNSISQTAAKHYMTPQGLSRAIHSIEEEVGVSLINRTSNTIYLSEAGKEFAVRAAAIIEAYETTIRSMAPFKVKRSEPASPGACLLVTPFVSRYIYQHISVDMRRVLPFLVRVQEFNLFRLLNHVAMNQDTSVLGLISFPDTPEYSQLVHSTAEDRRLYYTPLLSTPLQAEMSAFCALANEATLTLKQMSGLPLVCYSDTVLIDELSKIFGQEPILTTTNSSDVLMQELMDNCAVSFVPRIEQAWGLPKHVLQKPFEGSYQVEVGFLMADKHRFDERVNRMMGFMRDYFEECEHRPSFEGTFELRH